MEYQQFGERYVVRLASGENAIEALTRFLQQEKIAFANVSARSQRAGC
jgi:predicted DNA-binding protein with PD1-like motif